MKNILIIFLVLIIINVIYRLVNYYINPFNFFQGQDKIMNDSWDYSYGIGLLTLSDECDNLGDIIKNYVKSKYKNPKSIFRVKRNNKRYYYSNISINQILKNNFIEIDDNDIDFYKIYEDIKNKKLEWSYYYGKRKFLFVGHHTLFDGVSALNNSIGFFTNFKKFNSNISGNYIPIIDEFNILRSLPNLLNISKKINIHNYVKWETPLSQFKPKIINNSIPVSKIKNLKSKYKVNFIDVLVGYISKNVFKKFKNNYLNIGITVAFKSNNRFNNFGIVIIRIKNQDNIKKMILDINKKIQNNKIMIGSYYKLTNVYNLFNSFNSLDMIISSIYISKEKDLYLPTGQKLVNCNTINMHASVPVFVSSITLNDKIDLTYCIRTK